MPGACINDIKAAISKFPTSQKLHRLAIVVGDNDCDRRTDAKLEVAQILQEYENLIKAAKEVSVSVAISSVCPRNRGDEVTQRITTLNAGLKVCCEELGVDFIDNDPSFHLQDDSRNDGFLLADGIHLTRASTNKLVSNLQLVLRHGETSAHTDRRRRDQVATSQADPEQHQDDDDLRHPFWQQSRRKAARHSHGQNRPVYMIMPVAPDKVTQPHALSRTDKVPRQPTSLPMLMPDALTGEVAAPWDARWRTSKTQRPLPTTHTPGTHECGSEILTPGCWPTPLSAGPSIPIPTKQKHFRSTQAPYTPSAPLSVNYVSEKTTQQLHARVETVYAINVIREGTSPEHVSYRTRGLAASSLQRESFQWIF